MKVISSKTEKQIVNLYTKSNGISLQQLETMFSLSRDLIKRILRESNISIKSRQEISKQRLKARFWSKTKIGKKNDCWEWAHSFRKGVGYGQFSYYGYAEFAHRVAWLLTNGPIKKGLQVLHKCDNRKCVNPNHLFLGTQRENIHDMINKKRDALFGDRNPSAKLTKKAVLEIRKIRKTQKITIRRIAELYGVSYTTIWQILHKERWSWL
jgi:hypothetical protein